MLMKNGSPLVLYHGTAAEFETFWPLSHFGTRRAAERILLMNGSRIKSNILSFWPLDDFELDEKGCERIIPVHLKINRSLHLPDFDHSLFGYKLMVYQLLFARQSGGTPPLWYNRRRVRGRDVNTRKTFETFVQNPDCINEFRFIFNNPIGLSKDGVKKELTLGGLFEFTGDDMTDCSNVMVQRMIRFFESMGYDSISYFNNCEDVGSQSYIVFRPENIVRLDKVGELSHRPEATAELDAIRKDELKKMELCRLMPVEIEELYGFGEDILPYSFSKKMPKAKTYWMRFAFERVIPNILSVCKKHDISVGEVEQAVLFGIEYALKTDIRPAPVIAGCALGAAMRAVPQAETINTSVSFADTFDLLMPLKKKPIFSFGGFFGVGLACIPNAEKDIKQFLNTLFFDLSHEEQDEAAAALLLSKMETKPTDGIAACIWDALRTLNAWQNGTNPELFVTPFAKRLAAFTPHQQRCYLNRQSYFLSRTPFICPQLNFKNRSKCSSIMAILNAGKKRIRS